MAHNEREGNFCKQGSPLALIFFVPKIYLPKGTIMFNEVMNNLSEEEHKRLNHELQKQVVKRFVILFGVKVAVILATRSAVKHFSK